MSVIFKRPILSLDDVPTILWDNILSGSTIAVSSEVESQEGTNIVSGATNDYWTPSSLPATISFDVGSSKGAGYLGVASHNLKTSGCTITLQKLDGSWVDVFSYTPEDDSVFFVPFNYTEAEEWRLSVTGTSAPSIGVVFLGQAIQFETGILPSYTPMYMAEDIELLTSRTITGQFMPNRIQRRGLSTSFNLNILDRDFIEGTEFQRFRRYFNDGGSFFFASNPNEIRDDVSYCWRQSGGVIQPTFASDGIFYTVKLALEGFLD